MTPAGTEVVRTYFEMTSPDELRPYRVEDPTPRLEPVGFCPSSFYRYLYAAVGEAYHWFDRREWTDDQIRAHLDRPEITLWVLWCSGAPAGYFELQRHPDGAVEIAYFGLLPEFFGRGLGKHLLTEAAAHAWAMAPSRVWLHTCTLDHSAAVPNYRARGFRPYRQETYLVQGPG